MVPHPRDLKPGDTGFDVFAFKRALHSALADYAGLKELTSSKIAVQRLWGPATTNLYHQWQDQEDTTRSRVYDRANHLLLSPWYDAFGIFLISKQVVVSLCYPHPKGSNSTVCQGLHPTEGIPGNWANDFCASPGTAVLAVEVGRISRFSGHNPDDGVIGGDIFGWSLYLTADSGYVYFMTHCGSRTCQVGDRVDVGDKIATVGFWPHDIGRSHTHVGVTSPRSQTDAKNRISAVANATKVIA